MNYWFEWKGISSYIYREIIVQELPAIIKPRKRSEEYYIDGRSGSNIITLGYESYTKQCIIGLKHSERLDEIMNWLDGSGDLVFSNEPDKVYKAEIIEQISCDNYGRFKTAIISWLVYPFKFLKNEQPVTLPWLEQFVDVQGNIYNAGFLPSYPLIEIEASGIVNIEIDGAPVCELTAGDGFGAKQYAIDSGENGGVVFNMATGELAAGILEGNFPVLKPGKRLIKASASTGTLYEVKVYPRSRFL